MKEQRERERERASYIDVREVTSIDSKREDAIGAPQSRSTVVTSSRKVVAQRREVAVPHGIVVSLVAHEIGLGIDAPQACCIVFKAFAIIRELTRVRCPE